MHPKYAERVTDRESLHSALSVIFETYNGIKHATHPSGWPFPRCDLNYDLLRLDDCYVILLTRCNDLERAVSDEIAHQAGIWHFWNEADRAAMRTCAFEPLEVDKLRSVLARDAEFLSACRRQLCIGGTPYLELTYESLYGSGLTREEQLSVLDGVVAFLGLPALGQGGRHGRVLELLQPSTTGSDSRSLYRRIPNIDEIEAELGSDETGWLFK